MFKRQQIEAASHKLNNLGGQENKTPQQKLTGLFLGICKIPARIASGIRRLDLGLLTNSAMLLLIIVLFLALIGRVLDIRDDGKHSLVFGNAVAEKVSEKPKNIKADIPKLVANDAKTASAKAPADKPVAEVAVAKPAPKPIVKPKPVAPKPEVKPVAAEEKVEEKKEEKVEEVKTTNPRVFVGDVVITGGVGDAKLGSMVEIQGNLYVQNMRYFTLPCGTRITGDLIVRNVTQLRFCGCFDIEGNIYVSANSSFGAIPSNARLGGQVIF